MMKWFWWMASATSTSTTKPIDQFKITQSTCIHLWSALILTKNSEIHRKKHKQSEKINNKAVKTFGLDCLRFLLFIYKASAKASRKASRSVSEFNLSLSRQRWFQWMASNADPISLFIEPWIIG